MKIVRMLTDGPDTLLHVEAEGCIVHIAVGLHDMSGELYTSVEVTPAQPADDGAIWAADGPTAMLVRRRGRQILRGDVQASPNRAASGVAPSAGSALAEGEAS